MTAPSRADRLALESVAGRSRGPLPMHGFNLLESDPRSAGALVGRRDRTTPVAAGTRDRPTISTMR